MDPNQMTMDPELTGVLPVSMLCVLWLQWVNL